MANKRNYASGADGVLLSDADLELIARYRSDYDAAKAAGNAAGQQAAHDAAERVRARYGYSGGADGSEYLRREGEAEPVGSVYSGQIDAALTALLGREEFSYDPETDPLYHNYRKQYVREGRRATEEALGAAAAMTGGSPSSAAYVAAGQAGDLYAARLTDKIPELYSLAYSRYRDEENSLRQDLALLRSLEDVDLTRRQNAEDRAYERERDALSDRRYDERLAYDRAQEAEERDYSRGLTKARTLAAAGDFSGYAALGWSEAELASLQNAWGGTASASSGGSGRGTSSAGGTGTASAAGTGTSAGSGDARRVYSQGYRRIARVLNGSGGVDSTRVLDQIEALEDPEEQALLLTAMERRLRAAQ